MRLDRVITLNVVRPLHRVTHETSRITCLPVLMYHSVSDDPELRVHPYYRVCISPARFREHMQWLKDHGWQAVALSSGLAWLDSNPKMEVAERDSKSPALHTGPQSPNSELCPVVLTFDDGFRDFYTTAWPILHEFGFAATMYLSTAFVGGNFHSQLSTKRECLTWDEVGELHCAGVEFGSHTVNHPKLVELPWSEVELEIQKSKSEIEQHLGGPCAAFAYPYAFPQTNGNFVDRFKDLLLAGGYETCVTTQLGRHRSGDDLLQIKRLPINQEDDLPLFTAKLDGAYDWLGRVQSLSKTFRRRKALAKISPAGKQGVRGGFSSQPKTKSI